ncbi:hypothetical protein O3M35_005740 [Rhynocoris fuscipes]|uniref:Uncharacterized protein n=1 Tax=Rhynocoris fuscipes TaxID=488301 RepID=A0AAW1DJC6_9HEMI
MKYFLLQIWILPLVRGILSLPEGNQLDFKHKNYKNSWRNQILGRRKFSSDFSLAKVMQKRHLDIEKLSSVTKDAQNVVKHKNSFRTNDQSEPVTMKQDVCKQNIHLSSPAEKFGNVTCQQVPGRIICQAGKVTFVINNGDHHMDNDVIQRFVVMANQRYGEGDERFDVSVDDKETTLCPCYPEEITTTTREPDQLRKDDAPVVVECTLVSNEKLKMCQPFYDPSEKIYQCRAKKLGIKKRSIVHIAVHQNGTVSRVQDPIISLRRVYNKGESGHPLYEAAFIQHKKLKPRELRENDLSNLYYHTSVPYVRNYTDCCTLKCGRSCSGLEPTACRITKLATFNNTKRPCREAFENNTIHFETKNKTGPLFICTEVVTTNDAFNSTQLAADRKRRNSIFVDNANIRFNRNSNAIRNRRQNFLLGKVKTKRNFSEQSSKSGHYFQRTPYAPTNWPLLVQATPAAYQTTGRQYGPTEYSISCKLNFILPLGTESTEQNKTLLERSTNDYSVKTLNGESNSTIPKMRTYRRRITSKSKIKCAQNPSFGPSEQQSNFLTDKVKNNVWDLRTNYSEPGNTKYAEHLLNDISQSIKRHIRRKRKLTLKRKLEHNKIKN